MRKLTKSAVYDACRYLGVNSLSRALHRHKLLVLGYHGVVAEHRTDRFGYGNTVCVREFEQHLDFLGQCFQPVSADDVIAAFAGAKPLPERAALVTFDDGYRNNLTLAADILERKGIPAIVFLTTSYIGTDRRLWPDEVVYRILEWTRAALPLPQGGEISLPSNLAEKRTTAWRIKEQCKRLPTEQVEAYLSILRKSGIELKKNEELFAFLSWGEVRALRRRGFGIGSHTVNHPILTRIPPHRLEMELMESKLHIERELGEACTSIAYPNGGPEDVSDEVLQTARQAGYKLGFTVAEQHSGLNEDALGISRICVQGHLPVSAFEWRASGVDGLYRRAS